MGEGNRMKFFKIALALFAVQFPLLSCGQAADQAATVTLDRGELKRRPDPLLIGVGVHFGIGGEYNYIAATSAEKLDELGVDSYRDDLPWGDFDPGGQGVAGRIPAKLLNFMKIARQQPLIILGHPNPAVADGNPPLGAAGIKAFSDFAAAAALQTEPFRPIYEIWNEWNMNAVASPTWLKGVGTPEDPRAASHYAALARAAVPRVRQAVPEARVLAGAVGVDEGWSWAKAIVADGAVRDATALSVHLYNHCEADTKKRSATEMIDRAEALQKDLRGTGGKDVPIYVTEFGWPTAKAQCVIDEQTAADNIAQFLLWSAATPWLKGAWVYQLKDQSPDRHAIEANFGLYDYHYAPKPGACAVREAVRLIKGSDAFALSRPLPDLFLLQLKSATGLRLVAWTTASAGRASLTLGDGAGATAHGLCSGPVTASAGAYSVGSEPLVIDLAGTSRTTVKLGMAE